MTSILILLGFTILCLMTLFSFIALMVFVVKFKRDHFEALADTHLYTIHGTWFTVYTLLTVAYFAFLVA